MLRAPLIALGLTLLASPVLAQDGATPVSRQTLILPGYWESTNKVTFPITTTSVARKCIKAKDILEYMNGPSNNHYSCVYNHTHVADGAMSMDGECVDNNGLHSKIKVTGSYSPTTLQMQANLHLMVAGFSIPVHASTDAHLLDEQCPVAMK